MTKKTITSLIMVRFSKFKMWYTRESHTYTTLAIFSTSDLALGPKFAIFGSNHPKIAPQYYIINCHCYILYYGHEKVKDRRLRGVSGMGKGHK